MKMSENRENQYLLHFEDVYKRYHDRKGKEFTVLNDIDLNVTAGEFITLVGPSGCGKSTLLRLIMGSEQPNQGTVLFDGKPVLSPDRDRGIVFQKYSLFPHLTVLQNLVFGLEVEAFTMVKRMSRPFKYRGKRKEFENKALEYLERVGLAEHRHKYPQQLSGGMQQRVAIAQALIMQPKMMLMDEPFGALDYSTRQDMQVFILEQWEKTKMTIFFVTHDLEEAIFLGSRTLVLSYYYSTDLEANEGSKIVTDIAVPGPYPRTSEFKFSEEMGKLMEKVREDGLNPDHRKNIRDFDLSHKDSFRTVTPEEWKRGDDQNG
jgi:NitT/TauT family transport system ATP-binding protein